MVPAFFSLYFGFYFALRARDNIQYHHNVFHKNKRVVGDPPNERNVNVVRARPIDGDRKVLGEVNTSPKQSKAPPERLNAFQSVYTTLVSYRVRQDNVVLALSRRTHDKTREHATNRHVAKRVGPKLGLPCFQSARIVVVSPRRAVNVTK